MLSSAVHVPYEGRFYGWWFAYHKYVVYHHDFVIFAPITLKNVQSLIHGDLVPPTMSEAFRPNLCLLEYVASCEATIAGLAGATVVCVFPMCVKSTALEAHAAVACLNVTCSLSTKCHQIAHHKASMKHLAFFVVSKGKKNRNEQTLGGLTRWRKE